MIVNNGVCVIVQARLNSSRLPGKVLSKLDDNTLLEHVLNSLEKVSAQCFVLACDTASYEKFLPYARQYNFLLIAGSEEDVLSRFVLALETVTEHCRKESLPPISCIVRATADNPFLFIDAIDDSIARYFQLNKPDYFTFTALPKGSGVELINPKALLIASKNNPSEYEKEHVGPAIYLHKDKFRVIYETASLDYYFPELITTVDTEEDFKRAQYIARYLHHKNIKLPANASEIVEATKFASDVVIFIPCLKEGNGSGHLRRVIELALKLDDDYRSEVFIQADKVPDFAKDILKNVPERMLSHTLPKKAKLIILDNFQTDKNEAEVLKVIAPLIALDEGGQARENADYLLDIIPRLKSEEKFSNANLSDISFMPLPKNRKEKSKQYKIDFSKKPKILITCGGEDKTNMALPIGVALSKLNADITVITSNISFSKIRQAEGRVKILNTVENLREKLYSYDLVITIFGFTAFEALAAACLVILVSPTEYHYKLGLENGFSCLPPGIPNLENIMELFDCGIKIPKLLGANTQEKSLAKQIKKLLNSKHFLCPVCEYETHSYDEHKIVCRLPDRSISQCKKTGLYFLSFIMSDEKKYDKDYFFSEYKEQYGKTYLEDFANIMQQCKRRLKIIDECYKEYLEADESFFKKQKNILDIGCAYGAFLKVCEHSDWFAVGSDISEDAINYVKEELKLPAFCSAFPALPESFSYLRKDALDESETLNFELKAGAFQVITMWYVIEHFQDLNAVLKQVSNLLVDGGIFAFSTPTLSGISGTQNSEKFFAESPSDHYTIFDFNSVEKVLDTYGFKVIKIVSTGHHPERFKYFSNVKKGSLPYKILKTISERKRLGDSMEVYAIKRILV